MFKTLTLSIFLLQSFIPYTYAAAAAAAAPEVIVHDIIPGPGLPSLESLGLTSAQLYKGISQLLRFWMHQSKQALENPFSRHKLVKRFNNFCGGGRGATANVDDVIACFNYLQKLGHTACRVPAGHDQIEMCQAGTARVNGVSNDGRSQSSYWYDK